MMFKKLPMLGCLLFAWLVAAAAPEGVFDWSKARVLTPDIRHAEITLAAPRPLKIHAVRIDMNNPKLYLVTSPRAEGWGSPMPDYPELKIATKRTRVADFMTQSRAQGHDMRVAVNAAPWRPWTNPYNHKFGGKIGLAVADGVVVALPDERPVPALVVKKNGVMEMKTYKPGDKVDDLIFAVSGFDFVLRGGKQVCDNNPRLEPRTFYGLSQDGKVLYLMTADGRQKGYSEGMALFEGADWLRHLGASDGINMDGGGSTTLVFWKHKKPELINLPPGKGTPRYTRTVANSVGVCYRKK